MSKEVPFEIISPPNVTVKPGDEPFGGPLTKPLTKIEINPDAREKPATNPRRETAIFKGIEATWSPEDQAWIYRVPNSTLTLFWDEELEQFLPLAVRRSQLARERVSVFGDYGSQLYGEHIYIQTLDGITEDDLKNQQLIIRAKMNEFAIRTWEWLARLSWAIPVMFVFMVGAFFWTVFDALAQFSNLAAARLGAALGELAYYGTWAFGLAVACLVSLAIFPHLFRAAFAFARTSTIRQEPEPEANFKQGINVTINQGVSGGHIGQSGYAQEYVNH